MFRLEPLFDNLADGDRRKKLILGSPNRALPESDVTNFFEDSGAEISRLKGTHRVQIYAVKVLLPSIEGLTPYFLNALCTFLEDHPFPYAGNVTRLRRLSLAVVPSGGFKYIPQSEEVLTMITSAICRAFVDNDRVREVPFLSLDLAAAPCMETLEALFLDGDRAINVGVSADAGCRGYDRDALQIGFANGSSFNAEGTWQGSEVHSQVTTVLMRVLESTRFPRNDPTLRLAVFSPRVASEVAQCLSVSRPHLFKAIVLLYGGVDPSLSDTGICAAALRCPSFREVSIHFFQFSAGAVHDALAQNADSKSRAAVANLSFVGCTVVDSQTHLANSPNGDGALGICDLAMAMSQSSTLQYLGLMGTKLTMHDVKVLCIMLTRPEWSLKAVSLGGITYGGVPSLTELGVKYFFQHLPSMKTLKRLQLCYVASSCISPIIVNAMKKNYSLNSLEELTFGPNSSLLRECQSYTKANALGRDTIAAAVANLDSRVRLEKAISVFHRLSNSDNRVDETVRYVCMRLFLPAFAVMLGTGRTPTTRSAIRTTFALVLPSGQKKDFTSIWPMQGVTSA
jgi:hypothetical protein